jgi:exonuclease III
MWEKREKLSIIKEETQDLQTLLQESYIRLEREYQKKGGQTWWEYVCYFFGYVV